MLYDTFHHIQALLLFPPNCSCDDACLCDEWREKIILSLNTSHYTRSLPGEKDPKLLSAMKFYLDIPDAHLFIELYEEAYPTWLIKKELKKREAEKPFRIVDRLVWSIFVLLKPIKPPYLIDRRRALEKSLGLSWDQDL